MLHMSGVDKRESKCLREEKKRNKITYIHNTRGS